MTTPKATLEPGPCPECGCNSYIVGESMEQMDGTFDPETSNYALYHRLDVLLNPDLAGFAAAQNGGERPAPPRGK